MRNDVTFRGILVILAVTTAMAGEAADVRSDATVLVELRNRLLDELLGRLRTAGADARVLVIELPDGLAPKGADDRERRGLTLHLEQAGGAFAPGWGASPTYNKARHGVDASELHCDGRTLTGELQVTIKADPWVPADGQARQLVLQVDAGIADGALSGSAEASGAYGTYRARVTGSVAAMVLQAPPSEPVELTSDAAPAALAAAATRAYQEIRAAVRGHRHFPQDWRELDTATRLPLPLWEEGDPGIGLHVAALRRLAERAVERRDQTIARPADEVACDDPWFGPGGDRPLAARDGAVHLPDTVGADGPQEWRFVPDWQLLAVVHPDAQRQLVTPLLPDLLPAPGARYEADLATLGEDYAPPGKAPMHWVTHTAPFMPIPPPGQTYFPRTGRSHGQSSMDAAVHGVMQGRWYAATTVHAPRDIELWAAVLADDLGQLWIDEELVWMSDRNIQPHALTRLRLRAGPNRLLLCCQNIDQISSIGLAFCVRGGPRSVAERQAELAHTAEHSAALPPITCRGRHGDWTSSYPDASPPLAWNLRTGVNVAWRTPLPDYSAAPPVLWGDRVFVNCEPHSLYCLDAGSGEILWQRDAHVFTFVPEEQRPAAMAAWDQGWKASEQPEAQVFDERIAALGAQLRDESLGESQRAELEAQQEDLQEQRKQIIGKLASGYKRWCNTLGVKEPGWSNNYGWTMGAPVTDGTHVWVKYATGVAACYDLDGEQRWIAHTRLSGGVGNISSPVLLGGHFIVMGALGDKKEMSAIRGDWPGFMEHCLIAFDATSGAVAWKQPVWVSGGYGGASGMAPLRLANGRVTRELLLIGSGQVIDPVDGRIMTHLRGPGPSNWSGDPIVSGNRAYFRRGGKAQIVEYLLQDDGEIVARHIMTTDQGVSGQPGAVLLNDHLYGNWSRGMGRHPVPWHEAGAVDVHSGKRIFSRWPALREGGLAYTPPAAAGDYAVICGTGPGPHAWGIGASESAEIGFIRDGEQPYLVSTCQVQDEAMVAAPVFAGEAMFLRTYRSALCIRVTDDTGRDLVEEHRADTLIRDIPARPEQPAVVAVAPPAGYTPAPGVPVEAMDQTRTAPQAWLGTGALAKDSAEDFILAPAPAIVPGQPLGAGGPTFATVAATHVQASKGWSKDLYGRKYYAAHSTIDVLGACGGSGGNRSFYHTVLHNERERHAQVHLSTSMGQRFVLAGVELQDQTVLHLPPGHYPLTVRIDLGRVPPMIKQVPMSFFLVDVPDPVTAHAEWLTQLRVLRPRMEQVLAELGPGSARLRILKYLDLLDGQQ